MFDHILSGQVRFVEQRGVPYRGGRLTSHKATFHNCVPCVLRNIERVISYNVYLSSDALGGGRVQVAAIYGHHRVVKLLDGYRITHDEAESQTLHLS